jgi:pyrroline-5-carboxylate reductase
VKKAEVVIVAVKPKDLPFVAEEMANAFTEDHLLISVLAGVSTEVLMEKFPASQVLRIMPNLAITCGEGVIGLVESSQLKEKWKKGALELFKGLGLLAWIPEEKIDALTALAGAGPAFLIVLIEAIIESGIYLGLEADESRDYALQMISGAVALLRASTERHPGDFKWQIASPAGMTIAGIKTMEEKGIRGAMIDTFAEAYNKAKRILK